jgi:uncharacterized protein YidB (DUF937 family)
MSINIGDLLGSLTGGGSNNQQQQQQSSGGGGGGNLLASVLPALLPMLANGGLSKILGGMQAKGLTSQVDSWKADGANEQMSASEVKEVVDPDTLNQLAQKTGASTDQVADAISQLLPGLVDKATSQQAQARASQPEKKDDDGGGISDMLGSLTKQLGL